VGTGVGNVALALGFVELLDEGEGVGDLCFRFEGFAVWVRRQTRKTSAI
jgi:hypothetical protein